MKKIICVAALGLLCALGAFSQQVVVAVAPFTALDGTSASDARAIAEIFGIELQATGTVRVVTRGSFEAKMNELRFQLSDLSSEQKTAQLGGAMGANWVVRGQVQKLGAMLVVTATLLEVNTLEIMGGAPMYLSSIEETVTKMDGFIGTIKQRIGGSGGWGAAYGAILRTSAAPPDGMVYIEGGTFTMGSPASEVDREYTETQHTVTVSSFYMGKHEVTQAEYQEVMETNPSYFKGADLPVEQVDWYDAIEYCNKRSERERLSPAYTINKTRFDPNNTSDTEYDTIRWIVSLNKNANGYRLPTEAEWEYVCRAGTTTPFNTGSNITTNQANYAGDYPYNNNAKGTYREKTTTVGSFAPNRWGLYDMHGNVREWCWDWYGGYSMADQTDPVGAASGAVRVHRGGGWGDNGQYLRSANRGSDTPSGRDNLLGFRLVRP